MYPALAVLSCMQPQIARARNKAKTGISWVFLGLLGLGTGDSRSLGHPGTSWDVLGYPRCSWGRWLRHPGISRGFQGNERSLGHLKKLDSSPGQLTLQLQVLLPTHVPLKYERLELYD